jgi:hypothetical protein
LSNRDLVLQQLLAVQTIVEGLLKSLFSVRLPQGGFFHSGFEYVLSKIAPITHLLFGPDICPTVEQLLTKADLPRGRIGPVRFAGMRAGYRDESLFLSEIKSAELDFTRISSLRLIAYLGKSKLGAMGMLVIPVAEKLNRTLLTTDLDLTGASKLVVRIRCVLRNVQGPRRGFPS